MKQRWKFMLLTTMPLFGCAPALGQTAGPDSGTGSTISIPDFSGIWGRDWFTFEPPASGPGPLISKLRNPDGTLIHSAVGDYSNPILSPQAAEVVKKKGEIELSSAAFPSPHNQCWPEPTPYTLSIQLGLLLIQQKDEVILISLHDQ
jgi:hypothetical protein